MQTDSLLMNTPAMQSFLQKFSLPDRPKGAIPQIPQHLDDLSESDLMACYVEFMAWLSYSKAEMVTAEILEERCATETHLIEARTLILQWGGEKGDTVTLAKARRDVDNEVVEAQDKHLTSRAYRKLVETVFEQCERSAQILSRELSRRISMNPQERRLVRFAP